MITRPMVAVVAVNNILRYENNDHNAYSDIHVHCICICAKRRFKTVQCFVRHSNGWEEHKNPSFNGGYQGYSNPGVTIQRFGLKNTRYDKRRWSCDNYIKEKCHTLHLANVIGKVQYRSQ